MSQLAVNLSDLAGFLDGPNTVMMLLQPVLTQDQVDAEPEQFDGTALLLALDSQTGRWEAIYDILRNGLGKKPGVPKHTLRRYERSGSRWCAR